MTRGYTQPRPVYSFTGAGRHSWVRDAWLERHPLDGDDGFDAKQRLRDFTRSQADLAAKFATVDTTTAAATVPPSYRPLLASFVDARPLFAAATRGDILDATAFTVPGEATGVGGTTGDHTEGQAGTQGTLAFTPVTVTPAGVTGRLPLTREIVDSSNPAIDAVALAAMRESFARQTEAKLYSVVNGAGTSRTSTDLAADLPKAVVSFVGQRGQVARSVVVSAAQTVAESIADLNVNALGLQHVSVGFSPAFGTGTSDYDAVVLGAGDLWAWSSPLLELRYYEKNGPELVECALWGYFACALLTDAGVAGVQVT